MNKYLVIILLSFCYSWTSAQVVEIETFPSGLTYKQQGLIKEKVKLLPNQAQLAIALIEKGKVDFYGIKRQNDTSLL